MKLAKALQKLVSSFRLLSFRVTKEIAKLRDSDLAESNRCRFWENKRTIGRLLHRWRSRSRWEGASSNGRPSAALLIWSLIFDLCSHSPMMHGTSIPNFTFICPTPDRTPAALVLLFRALVSLLFRINFRANYTTPAYCTRRPCSCVLYPCILYSPYHIQESHAVPTAIRGRSRSYGAWWCTLQGSKLRCPQWDRELGVLTKQNRNLSPAYFTLPSDPTMRAN